MTPSRRLRPARVLLQLSCAALLLGGAAHARREACDAAANGCLASGSAAAPRDPAVAAPAIAVTTRTGGSSTAAGAALTSWQADLRVDASALPEPLSPADAAPAPPGEPPLLGLVLAAVGVVGFMAHRRGGR